MLPGRDRGWWQAGPKSVASRTPFHTGETSGGFQRRTPIGGRAYGRPLKTCRLPIFAPRTLPAGASTMGRVCAAAVHAMQSDVIHARSPVGETVIERLHSMLPALMPAPATGEAPRPAHRTERAYRSRFAEN